MKTRDMPTSYVAGRLGPQLSSGSHGRAQHG